MNDMHVNIHSVSKRWTPDSIPTLITRLHTIESKENDGPSNDMPLDILLITSVCEQPLSANCANKLAFFKLTSKTNMNRNIASL